MNMHIRSMADFFNQIPSSIKIRAVFFLKTVILVKIIVDIFHFDGFHLGIESGVWGAIESPRGTSPRGAHGTGLERLHSSGSSYSALLMQ